MSLLSVSDEVTHVHTYMYNYMETRPQRSLVMYNTAIFNAHMLVSGQLVFVMRISVPFHESVATNRTLYSTSLLSVK